MEYLEEDKITIYPDDDICTTCGKSYKHRKIYMMEDNMKMVRFITSHPGCRVLIDKIQKLKEELTDLEYKLFCKSI
jgi:hypothetical protein